MAAGQDGGLVRRLIDIDARRAQRAEAQAELTTVLLGGEEFDFPVVNDWPVAILDLLRNGDLIGAIRLLLDEGDLTRFLATRPTMADLSDLFEGLGSNAGIGGLGNSRGSRTSSTRARKKLNATSKGSTA